MNNKETRYKTNTTCAELNAVKSIKNNIYEKTLKIFTGNLKKLIQFEGTQKELAKKIGISQDLLSKYKSGEAFPSIETLIYICQVYNINLNKFLTIPLTSLDIHKLESKHSLYEVIFENKYYVYFFVTNMIKEGALHEGVIEFSRDEVTFKILSDDVVVKCFSGEYFIDDKLVSFNFHSINDGNAYISMIKPNVNINKYSGGLAMLSLPSDANSKPCCQKLLFSKTRINRELYYDKLKSLLSFHVDSNSFGNIKISLSEDEKAYNFIEGYINHGNNSASLKNN